MVRFNVLHYWNRPAIRQSSSYGSWVHFTMALFNKRLYRTLIGTVTAAILHSQQSVVVLMDRMGKKPSLPHQWRAWHLCRNSITLTLDHKLVHTISHLIFTLLIRYFLKPVTLLLLFLHLSHCPLVAVVFTQCWNLIIFLLFIMLQAVDEYALYEPHPLAYCHVVLIQQ